MMRMSNIRMTTSVDRRKLMSTLRDNLSKHSAIVQEARDGYIQKARQALEQRLDNLRKGAIVSLQFTLAPPVDYSEVYKNAISMLEWNQDDTIELEADEFRQLVLDQWDWNSNFLLSNSRYSKIASDSIGGSAPQDEADFSVSQGG